MNIIVWAEFGHASIHTLAEVAVHNIIIMLQVQMKASQAFEWTLIQLTIIISDYMTVYNAQAYSMLMYSW